jgi:hypothetical protein
VKTLAIAALGMFVAAAVFVYGTVLLLVLTAIRDWLHSRRQIRRMVRSGEPKRVVPEAGIGTWVVDEDGNAIDCHGNSFTIHAKQ